MDEVEAGLERRRGVGIIGAQDLQELRRAVRAVVNHVVLVRAELRRFGRGAQLLLAVAQRRRPFVEIVPGAPQRIVDGVDLADGRIADGERLAAAQRARRPRWPPPAAGSACGRTERQGR